MDTSATHGGDHNNSNNNGGVSNKRACAGIYRTENQEDANKRRVVLEQSKNNHSSDQTMITVESDDDDEGVGSGPLGLKLSKKAKKEIIELISKLHTSSPVDDDDDQLSESCGSSSTPEAFGDVAVRDEMTMLRKRYEQDIDDLELKLLGVNADAESTKEA